MRYYFDTEFQEGVTNKGRGFIWLISLGIVAEDGRRAYWECWGFDWFTADQWLVDNVKPHLTGPKTRRKVIWDELVDFVGDDPEPEFWAYVDPYDWIAMVQLGGGLMYKPKSWPHSSHDLKELMLQAGLSRGDLPVQEGSVHRADDDAEWVRVAHAFILQRMDEIAEQDPVRLLLAEWKDELDLRYAYSGDPDPGGTRALKKFIPLLEEALKTR